MDTQDELPELLNGLSLQSSTNGDGVTVDVDSLLREISSLFGSIYGRFAFPSRESADE